MNLSKEIKEQIRDIKTSKRSDRIKDILLFMAIIIGFSILGYLWKILFHYRIFGVEVLEPSYRFLIHQIIASTAFIMTNIIHINTTPLYDTQDLLFVKSNVKLFVNHGCSGLKELAMFAILILVFPGGYKIKLWFLPLALILIFGVAILRIVFLSVMVSGLHMNAFHLFHEYIFNIVFFVIFFLLWVFWLNLDREKKLIHDNNV